MTQEEEMQLDYTKRNDFTSEIFKIQVKGVKPQTSTLQFKKFLEGLGVKSKKIKITAAVSFVTFASENDRNKALEVLKDVKFRNRELQSRVAKPIADPCIIAQQNQKPISQEEFLQSILEATAPYSKTPYDEQIALKTKKVESVFNELKRLIEPKLKSDLDKIQIDDFVKSPVTTEYRNKCELSFGYGYDNSELTIGFKSGKYKDGMTRVSLADDITLIPKAFVNLAKSLEKFLRKSTTLSFLAVFDNITHVGHLKQIMLRNNRKGETYLQIIADPQDISQENIATLLDQLEEWANKAAKKVDLKRVDVLLKKFADKTPMLNKSIFGDDFVLKEECCGKLFSISPESFFQINIEAAELLYREIGRKIEMISSDNQKCLLDICSGIGTIGQCLSDYVKKIIGIEIVSQAVEDSEKNAKANKISHASYMCGRAEDIISLAVQMNKKNYELIAVLDPPRCGLNNSVIKAIRKCNEIKHVFYVACDFKSALQNFIALLQNETKRCTGDKFKLDSVTPFDFFPSTEHVEVLLKFSR